MNCIYEMNGEQEVRGAPQYHPHSNGYTTLTTPSAATMMMMESAAAAAAAASAQSATPTAQTATATNTDRESIKQATTTGGEILLVSILDVVTYLPFFLNCICVN